MKCFYKSFAATLIFVFAINSVAMSAYAQGSGETSSLGAIWQEIKQEIQEKGQSVDGLEIPYLEARRIELFQDSYGPGDRVEGMVIVRNGGTISADGIVPTVSLIGDYNGLVPTAQFDSKTLEGSFSIAPGEVKTISFAYQLPGVFLSSDLGIQVEFYTDTGLRQDSISKRFTATGSIQRTRIIDTNIMTRDRIYGLRTTPTVYDGDELVLNIAVVAENETVIQPQITLHDFSAITGAVVTRTPYTQEIIPSGESALSYAVNVNLPMGLYEGVATFTNETGDNVVPPVSFLFIRAGDGTPFMIRNITLHENNNIISHLFRVSYTGGAPDLDIFGDNPNRIESMVGEGRGGEFITDIDSPLPLADFDYDNLTVKVTVTDTNGVDVAEGSVSAAEAGDFTIDVPVNLSRVPAGTYTVLAHVINQDGAVINSYEKSMFLDTGLVKESTPIKTIIFVGLILVIMLIVVLVRMRLTKKENV